MHLFALKCKVTKCIPKNKLVNQLCKPVSFHAIRDIMSCFIVLRQYEFLSQLQVGVTKCR